MNRHEEGLPLRVYAIAAGVIALGALAATLVWLFHTQREFAGTNSVAPRYVVLGLRPHQQLCVRSLDLPGDAAAVRMRVQGSGPPGALTLRLKAGGGERVSHARLGGGTDLVDLRFPIARSHRVLPARACLSTGTTVGLAGEPSSPDGSTQLDGQTQAAKVSIWFLLPSKRSVAASLPDAPARAALFRAGVVGAWTYVLIPVLMIVLWLAGLGLLRRTR